MPLPYPTDIPSEAQLAEGLERVQQRLQEHADRQDLRAVQAADKVARAAWWRRQVPCDEARQIDEQNRDLRVAGYIR